MQGVSLGRLWVSSCWFLAFVLAFLVRGSYGYASAAIALAGIIACFMWKDMPPLSQATRRWIIVLLSYVAIMLILLMVTEQPLRTYERITRYFLALPLVLAIWRWRPSQALYVAAISLAAIIAFAVVFHARIMRGLPAGSNFGYQMSIQFADITMLMAVAALFISFAYRRLGIIWWLLHLCALLAITGAFLSGGRGSWLVLIPTVILYIAATERQKRLKTFCFLLMALVGIMTVLYMIPQTQVAMRATLVFSDLQKFQTGNSFSSQGARLEMWKCSFHLFEQQPWVGAGNALEQLMTSAAQEGVCNAAVKGFGHVHNDFLDMFVRYGILGGLATLLMYLAPAYLYLHALRLPLTEQQSAVAWMGLAVCIGFYVCSLSNAILTHNITSIFFLLFNAWCITGIGKYPVPLGKYV